MSQVEFIYEGVSTVIQCNSNEKMKDIFQRFKNKVSVNPNKSLFYSYDGKLLVNEELSF